MTLSPTRPVSTAFLDALRRTTARKLDAYVPAGSPFSGADDTARDAVTAAVAVVGDEAVELARALHAHPEEAFGEFRSVAAIADMLRAHGSAPTVGSHGLDTALRVGLTTDGPDDGTPAADRGPAIALFAEYDAWPQIGHGCGHHLITGAALGAFLALHHAVRGGLTFPGRVLLLGTPAEEGNSGKEILARAGFLEGVDAAIMVHPFGYDVVDQPFLGRRQQRVTYHGTAAHASASPFQGRNALDAVALNYQAVRLPEAAHSAQ